jgi:DNA-binding XRE family transcriptional regulator
MTTLRTGRQLQAARALAGYDRTQLAKAAGLTAHTIKRLELQDRISAHINTVDAIEKALAEAGVVLLNGDAPGVRLRGPIAA